MHVRTIGTARFMRSNSPRKRDDVNSIFTFFGTCPCIIFVINNPLQSIHRRFVKFLGKKIIFERSCPSIGSDTNINKGCIWCRSIEVSLFTVRIDSCSSGHSHTSSTVLITIVWVVASILDSPPGKNTSWVGVYKANSIVACYKFLT